MKKRDVWKKKVCIQNGIRLISIKDVIYHFKMDEGSVKNELKEQFKKMNIKYDYKVFNETVFFDLKVKRSIMANNSKISSGRSKKMKKTVKRKLN